MLAALESDADMTLPLFVQFMTHRGGKSAGAIRVSLGLVSNFADVDASSSSPPACESDPADDRRGHVRHRLVPRHPRRKLARNRDNSSQQAPCNVRAARIR